MNYRKGKEMKSRSRVAFGSKFEGAVALNQSGNMRDAFTDISAGGRAAFKFIAHEFFWADIDTFFQEKVDGKRSGVKMAKGMNENELFFMRKRSLGIDFIFKGLKDGATVKEMADSWFEDKIIFVPIGNEGLGRGRGGG